MQNKNNKDSDDKISNWIEGDERAKAIYYCCKLCISNNVKNKHSNLIEPSSIIGETKLHVHITIIINNNTVRYNITINSLT